ncbi:MAG: hypothetical protein ACK46G_01190 [Flavobacteriales bacterium]
MSLSFCAFGQANLEDVVYLKNGSMYRGIIVEQRIGESLSLKMSDGSVLVFRMEEIVKIAKEESESTKQKQLKEKTLHKNARSGYYGLLEVSYGLQLSEDRSSSSATNKVGSGNTMRLNYNPGLWTSDGLISLSMLVGIEKEFEAEGLKMPLMLDMRFYASEASTTLMVVLQGGYVTSVVPDEINLYGYPSTNGVTSVDGMASGFQAAAGVGFMSDIGSDASLLISVMYDYQGVKYRHDELSYYTPSGYGGISALSVQSRLLRFALGVRF